jgi:hypothetical protein
VEICYNSKGYYFGLRFYDKQDKNIFEKKFTNCQHKVTTSLKDGEIIVDYALIKDKDKLTTYLDFVISK